MKEYELQKAVCRYMDYHKEKILYCGSAGGVRTSITQAKKMKATGYKKGFPDLFIYNPKGKYNGLAIELKVKGNYPSKEQKEWLSRLTEQGYYAVCCKGFEDARTTIDNYFSEKL
ncbi:MAG: hypothetical protein Unbinned5930contig1000_21 [Prokaryotic dsDNA virus sp.]|nr:MAG: hypothetical protein Unbinned5930contig1000_21 [Prokaryotic dsDNA virus sp.]|tara:strand:- start:1309 stop:1653 length:345 start_codon:yes stop_codon:yes gene_type:complete